MPRGVKPKPEAEKLSNKVVTHFNNEDYHDLKQLVHGSDYENISEFIRARLLNDLKQFRLSRSKQLKIT